MDRKTAVVLVGLVVGLAWAAPAIAQAQPLLPSSVLNLTNWKLTLPVAAPGSDVAQEIKQPALNSYSDSFFHVDSTGKGVVFTGPVDGATTSGSHFPRSELREMTDGGTQKASWSTTDGTHTMSVTEAVTELPPVKPQVVAAQIHSPDQDVIEIEADGLHSVRPGTVALGVRFEGTTQARLLDPTYVLGQRFKITLKVRDGRIKVAFNDRTMLTLDETGSGMYFKAGAYTQSNPSKGDVAPAAGQVIIYKLAVTHTS
jgi:poly(beta-D-mannuronate) lyase